MPVPVAPQSVPVMQLSTTFRRTSLELYCFLPTLAGVGELPLAQVDCFGGCPHHVLDLFAHILTPPTLQLSLERLYPGIDGKKCRDPQPNISQGALRTQWKRQNKHCCSHWGQGHHTRNPTDSTNLGS